ncbi:alpha-mannosidase [Pelagicoccus mobilis]|uniref:Alpha-mannosidase n=1 Tax=Pelagicoccus mobilis TaxID=415221 RepID=A0A934VMS8_9BACT|nr:alpha-mannosidase [Pelagicoccus mobilis]MBK1875497.1 alpha-mannosidase [Pelagicoccus mobilis]
MLPRNHILKFAPRRALTNLKLLKRDLWQTVETASINKLTASGEPRSIETPHYWGKIYGEQGFTIDLPNADNDGQLWLRWIDQGESTLYIDGKPFFGFDVAHRECLLPKSFSSLEIRAYCIQSAIWHPEATGIDPRGSELKGAFFIRRSEAHWKLIHDLQILIELIAAAARKESPELSNWFEHKGVPTDDHNVTPFTRQLARALESTCDLLDLKKLDDASALLDQTFENFPSEAWNLDATVNGHSHIDLVWMWPESIGETKAVHTFTNVDYLMDRYPEFQFGYSQPASYEAVKRLDPALFDRVSNRIEQGRWEAYGAMYVESDTLIPCGEALARSFELGQAGFAELNGSPSKLCWLPDVFGYSGSLPQLMKHYGVEYFFTNKVTWSESVAFPLNSFKWVGSDGSEILTHIHGETVQFYNGCATVDELERAQNRHHQADTHKEVLIPTGYGDGGGGPTEEMCERIKRLQNLASMPRCKWGNIEPFYDRLDTLRDDLPNFHGEILIQKHRGTYTSRSTFKSRYRSAEKALQLAEIAAATKGSGPINETWWKRVVFSQFHDILPGSSVTRAYLELEAEFDQIIDEAKAFTSEILSSEEGSALFNTSPFDAQAWTEDGKLLKIPAYQSAEIALAESYEGPAVNVTESTIGNEHLKAVFNNKGEIESLEFGGAQVASSAPLNQLWVYPNRPHDHQAWEIDRTALSLGQQETSQADVSINRTHDGLVELCFKRKLSEKSSVLVTYRCDATKPYLEISYDIDWQEEHSYLKAIMPTEYRGDNVRYGQAVGSTVRNQNPKTITDEAQFEVPGSRWALISDDGEREGLSVVTENKYGFSARHGTIGVSLLSSPLTTGEGPGFQNPFPNSLREDIPENICADLGRHSFKLILAPWQSGKTEASQHPAALADYAFTEALTATQGTKLPIHGVKGLDSVFISWIQPCEDGNFIVKTTETMGARGTVKLLLDEGFRATPIDGLKTPLGTALENNEFQATPYKLNCFLITAN